VPPAIRQRFVDGFSGAGGGLEVGTASSSAAGHLSGLPPAVAAQIAAAAHDVFAYGFIDAMRPTLLVPIAALAIGTVSCLAIRRRRRAEPAPARREQEAAPAAR
jgi:hypothetical protein